MTLREIVQMLTGRHSERRIAADREATDVRAKTTYETVGANRAVIDEIQKLEKQVATRRR